MATNSDQLRKTREDIDTVESFSKRYYDILDTQRHNVGKFYQNQAKLIWNGNEINGQSAIASYLIALPPSKHYIYSLDYLPMKDLFPNEDTTYQVFTSGAVVYGSSDSAAASKEKRLFSHIFVLTVDVGTSTWVVANECFRFHE